MVRYDHIPRIMFAVLPVEKQLQTIYPMERKKDANEERVAQGLKIRKDIVYELKKS